MNIEREVLILFPITEKMLKINCGLQHTGEQKYSGILLFAGILQVYSKYTPVYSCLLVTPGLLQVYSCILLFAGILQVYSKYSPVYSSWLVFSRYTQNILLYTLVCWLLQVYSKYTPVCWYTPGILQVYSCILLFAGIL